MRECFCLYHNRFICVQLNQRRFTVSKSSASESVLYIWIPNRLKISYFLRIKFLECLEQQAKWIILEGALH